LTSTTVISSSAPVYLSPALAAPARCSVAGRAEVLGVVVRRVQQLEPGVLEVPAYDGGERNAKQLAAAASRTWTRRCRR
jgi:hypothetical protein